MSLFRDRLRERVRPTWQTEPPIPWVTPAPVVTPKPVRVKPAPRAQVEPVGRGPYPRTCVSCGARFESRYGTALFCSGPCRSRARRRERTEQREETLPADAIRRRVVIAVREQDLEPVRKPYLVTCRSCGRTFESYYSRSKWCSRACREREGADVDAN